MKLIARVGSDWFVVPCTGEESVHWLGEEVLRRSTKRHPDVELKQEIRELRKTRGGAALDLDDKISCVLEDEEHVSVGKSRITIEHTKVTTELI